MGPLQVAVLAQYPREIAWAGAVQSFVHRGDGVRVRPIGRESELGQGELLLQFRPTAGNLLLIDAQGRPWAAGEAAAEAILVGQDQVSVWIVGSDGSGCEGRVGVLRSVSATVDAGAAVAGPLLVQWASGRRVAFEPRAPLARSSRRRADLKGALRFVGRLARASVTVRNWQVARLPTGLEGILEGGLPDGPLQWQGPTRGGFWADPCVLRADGAEWLFVEELGRRSGVGVIRAARARAGRLEPGEVVLATDHHLSFPQVYRVGRRWLATVETCARTNPVYEFDEPGRPWRVAADMPALPPNLADPVLEFEGDMLRGVWGTDAATDADAVFTRFDYSGSAWRRVEAATFVDVLSARGGGTLDLDKGLRAVQECAGTYGRAVSVVDLSGLTILRLTPDRMGPSTDGRRRKGVHTLTWCSDGSPIWVDGWLRRFTALGAMWRLRERHHGHVCSG